MRTNWKQANFLESFCGHGQSSAAKLSVTEQNQCGRDAEQRKRKIDWHSKGEKEGLQDLSQNGILMRHCEGQSCEGIDTDIVYPTRPFEPHATVAW